MDHHVRVACVKKNSNLLRYFNKCIAINISYWASPLEKRSNQFFGQKTSPLRCYPKISKSWATGHKTHWSSFKLLLPQTWPVSKTVSKRCCLSTKIWRHMICNKSLALPKKSHLVLKMLIWNCPPLTDLRKIILGENISNIFSNNSLKKGNFGEHVHIMPM